MKKNIFYFALGAVFFGLSVHVDAQQPAGKVPRIGFLANSSASIPVTGLRLDAFRQGLRELATSRGKTSSSNIDMPKGNLSDCQS
jgi:hypothetical protein